MPDKYVFHQKKPFCSVTRKRLLSKTQMAFLLNVGLRPGHRLSRWLRAHLTKPFTLLTLSKGYLYHPTKTTSTQAFVKWMLANSGNSLTPVHRALYLQERRPTR